MQRVEIEAYENVGEGFVFAEPILDCLVYLPRVFAKGACGESIVVRIGDDRVLRVGLRYEFLGSALTKPTAGLYKLS